MNNRFRGVYGEELATQYLCNLGYKILDKNVVLPGSELDIVALDGSTIVFVEVKTRENTQFGTPIEAITPVKIKRIIKGAKLYVVKHKLFERPIRFDVIGILRDNVEHIKNAFWSN